LKQVKLYLNSGQVVEFFAKDIYLNRNTLQMTFTWESADDETKERLMFVRLENVNAITSKEVKEDEPPS